MSEETVMSVEELLKQAEATYGDACDLQRRRFGTAGINRGIAHSEEEVETKLKPLPTALRRETKEAGTADNPEVLVAKAQFCHAIAVNMADNVLTGLMEGREFERMQAVVQIGEVFQELSHELHIWERLEEKEGRPRMLEKARLYVARAGVLFFLEATTEAIELYAQAVALCRALNPTIGDPALEVYVDVMATTDYGIPPKAIDERAKQIVASLQQPQEPAQADEEIPF